MFGQLDYQTLSCGMFGEKVWVPRARFMAAGNGSTDRCTHAGLSPGSEQDVSEGLIKGEQRLRPRMAWLENLS